jgi:serine/threonine-protein kinase
MMDTILPEKLTAPPSSVTPSISRLPDEILRDGSKRLQVASLLYASGILIVFFGVNLAKGSVRPGLFIEPRSLIAGAAVLMGLGFFAVARYASIPLTKLMDLGLIFLVLSTFLLSMANTWDAYPTWEQDVFGVPVLIPFECVWILIFPLLAPNTPGKTLLAAYTAATTVPLALLLSMAFGATSPDAPFASLAAYFLITIYLCAFLAYVISRSIYKVGARLKEAQDIGSYCLDELLGAGGMGEVWVAEHCMLARPAAIKLIRPEMLGTDRANREMVSRRFEREAQATAALHSPHTISIYDFGVTEDASFYYVMELLEGMNLDELIKVHGPIPAGRAVYLLQQVCQSLADAHNDGLIHRDINPANIFVCRMGLELDFIKVLDFGLVKTPEGVGQGVAELTVEGMAYGTPGFMAPEIAMGEKEIDGRVDIYGVGCVAYWLLTGKRVFKGETPMAEAIHHIQSQPVPPSERTQISVPESLEKVILSCLEKDPADRPQSAHELGRLLGQSIPAGAWNQEEAEEWWRLHMPKPVARSTVGLKREPSAKESLKVN